MNNRETRYALEYHDGTKHSEWSLQMAPHYLDWDDRPLPFKVYYDLPHISLPQEFPIPTSDALACIRNASPLKQESQIDIAILSQILFFSAGITREMKY